MPITFPWEIRGESAEQEVKVLKKKIEEQYQKIKDLESTVDELKHECVKRKQS